MIECIKTGQTIVRELEAQMTMVRQRFYNENSKRGSNVLPYTTHWPLLMVMGMIVTYNISKAKLG